MHKSVRNAIYWVASIAIGLILIFTSAEKHKLTFAQTSLDDAIKPLVILVDNSGSMGWGDAKYSSQNEKCLPGKTPRCKIDIVKDAIPYILESFNLSKIGLVEFGNWREYADYPSRCTAVDPLVKPSIGSRDKVLEALEEIKANHDGVTPTPFALSYVFKKILKPRNLLPGTILLFTDNEPTCKEQHFDLHDVMVSLEAQGAKIEMVIITYESEGRDREFKECVKNFPDICKNLWSADNLEELKKVMEKALYSLGYMPSISTEQQNQANKSDEWGCTLRWIGILLMSIICILVLALTILIILAPILPNSSGWLGIIIMRIRQLVPSDQTWQYLLGAIAVLAAILGVFATIIEAIPCHLD